MKRMLFYALMFLSACLVVLFVGSRGDEPLDPSVEKLLDFKSPEVAPAENAYVGVSGLANVQDGDVVTAGQKYLAGGDRPASDSEEGRFDSSYKNPCLNFDNDNCLEQIAAEAAAINEAVQNNTEFLERYYVVQKMPLFVNTASSFNAPTPRYQRLLDSSRLIGAKALLDIKQNGLAAGLETLEADLNFYKRMSRSEHVNMIDLMVAVAGLKIHLLNINGIIENDQISVAGYEDRLRKLLDLNLNVAKIMESALNMEKRQAARLFESPAPVAGWYGNEDNWQERVKWQFYALFYKKNMTLNRLTTSADKVIDQIGSTPFLNFPDFMAAHEAFKSSSDSLPTVKELYDLYGLFFFKNYTGEFIVHIAQSINYMKYLARVNDIIVYSRLVRANLELRLMKDRPADTAETLAGLGPETWNPYTGKPFNWDREQNILWTKSAIRTSTASGDPSYGWMKVAAPDRRP